MHHTPYGALLLTCSALLIGGCGDGNVNGEGGAGGTFRGTFATVPAPPEGTKQGGGTAVMTITDAGTKLTIAPTGLDPEAVYVAHVHDDACSAADPGGAHFKFNRDAGDMPPNEIHIGTIAITKTGVGTGETTNEAKAGADAKSIVVHLKRRSAADTVEAKPPKILCADLSRN